MTCSLVQVETHPLVVPLPSPAPGGRIFYPGSSLPTACPITEDEEWRTTQAAAGPANQDCIEPAARQGVLWAWHKELKADGWTLDATGYTTSFRSVQGRGMLCRGVLQ